MSFKKEPLNDEELTQALQEETCPFRVPINQIMIAVQRQPTIETPTYNGNRTRHARDILRQRSCTSSQHQGATVCEECEDVKDMDVDVVVWM